MSPESAMCVENFLLEDDTSILQLVAKLLGAFLDRVIQLFLKLVHAVEYLGKRLAH
jgi:hypothetical protein